MKKLNFRRWWRNLESLESREVPALLYVAPTGQDSNAGTAAAPLQTLQAAANRVAAGDTVIVSAGTYRGFNLTKSGAADARITFQADPAAPKGSVVINLPNGWTGRDGINLEGASYVTIDGFSVFNQPRAGIRAVTDQNVIIRNNVADNNGYWGIFTGFSSDLLIENNEASRSGLQHGIYVSNSADRPTVRGNLVWGNAASGIQLNADASQGGDGVISNALIENNVIHDNGRIGGASINLDGVEDSVVRNNLVYNAQAGGIALFWQDANNGSRGNEIENNTVLVNNAADPTKGRWAVYITGGSVGNRVTNNILFSSNPNAGALSVTPDSLPGTVSDYNVVEDHFATDGVFGPRTAWQAVTGQDAHSVAVADPATLFVNAAGNDYRLKAGSAAVNAGTATNVSATDLAGAARVFGAGVDAGSYEYAPQTLAAAQPVARVVVADDGQSSFATAGTGWQTAKGDGSWFMADTRYRLGTAAAAAGTAARWTVPTTPGETYVVSATWAATANRATDATFRVLDADGTVLATVTVNQQKAPADRKADGAAWKDLTDGVVAHGTALTIELDGRANGYVIADAVRVQQVLPVVVPPVVPPPPAVVPPPASPPAGTGNFTDDFSAATPGAAWTFVGGSWVQANGLLRQASAAPGDPFKAIVADRTWSPAQEITASVRVDTWVPGSWTRAGVGVRTNAAGEGYNLVFRGQNQVQFLNDHVAWGNAYAFAWQPGVWYTFHLRADADGTLRGNVWAAGTAEPAGWMFTQTGWGGRAGGSPALNGGSNGDGWSTVSFDNVTAAPLPAAPPLFTDALNGPTLGPAWTTGNGAWGLANGALSQTSAAIANEKKATLTGLAAGAANEVQARVRVDSWTAGPYARAGVGLGTDAAGLGYNLVFRDGNTVQFLNDQVAWGNAFAFNWQPGTWYTFRMRQDADGTLHAKVWADGQPEPADWTFTQTGWAYRAGWASLNGGSAALDLGNSTASFDGVTVWA